MNRSLLFLAILSLAFLAYTQIVAASATSILDVRAAHFFAGLWSPAGEPAGQVLAVLGGVEFTVLLILGLALYLWRAGFRAEVWVALAYPAAVLIEVLYKRLLDHPGPFLHHADGPSPSDMAASGAGIANSYPSGHMVRTVLVYGLLAFVLHRLLPDGWGRRLALPLAAIMIALMALDRLYLGVHWQSDVIGGALLGGAALAGAIAWLEVPRG
ncbi:MAG: phosphatase PAP2 family protein [Candidatus Dormibacteraeota bacterium]|uniref:Phosphatase PAP2 family protein n=1 Tax=Candidatus Dormiibacter inghamiae TaxID=3127013 RepID=A0A934ND94_9BACT|nr:phosphatase PAP2 family protein [Candidatus Dormibacteraeota bacterium]